MDWKTFIVEIVRALAWPVVVCLVTFLLKEKLSELLPRIKKLKHNNTEFEFAEGVGDLVKKYKDVEPAIEENSTSKEFTDKHLFISKLAEISPRSAVIEAFREVELTASKAVSKLTDPSSGGGARSIARLRLQLESTSLSKDDLDLLQQLGILRNKAAHYKDFDLHGMPIQTYIKLSLGLASRISAVGNEL